MIKVVLFIIKIATFYYIHESRCNSQTSNFTNILSLFNYIKDIKDELNK